jgi:UDP-N-acetylglucosamine:LPS N-acetylglucosamine transferase
MNVLHIVPSYYPAVEVGGPVQSVHEINKYMAKKGINIDVLTLTVGLEKNKSIVKDGWSMIDSVKIKYLNYLKPTRYNFSLSFLLSCFRILKRYDVIHITGIWNFPVLAGALASVFYKKPFVLSPRGSLYEETVSMKSSAIKKFYLFLFRPVIIGKAAVMHYTT